MKKIHTEKKMITGTKKFLTGIIFILIFAAASNAAKWETLVFNEDINIKLPWEIEVSDKLIMYELLDKRYDNMDDIIGELCK